MFVLKAINTALNNKGNVTDFFVWWLAQYPLCFKL